MSAYHCRKCGLWADLPPPPGSPNVCPRCNRPLAPGPRPAAPPEAPRELCDAGCGDAGCGERCDCDEIAGVNAQLARSEAARAAAEKAQHDAETVQHVHTGLMRQAMESLAVAIEERDAARARVVYLEETLRDIAKGNSREGCDNLRDPGDGSDATCIERDADDPCLACVARAALGAKDKGGGT